MDCFLDFCLACDKQTTDSVYCSQACRLTDLEKAGNSAPASPSSSGSIDFSDFTGFDFGIPKETISKPTSQQTASRERVLSPSTSRSSLASAASNVSTPTNQTMSQQTQHELQGYVSSFDSIREMKRRSLSSNTGL